MKNKNYLTLGAVFLLSMLFSTVSFADSIGSVADGVVQQETFSSILSLFFGVCYVVGALFGIKCVLQLKEHTDSPNQVKFMKPVFSMFVCAILLSMPSFLQMLQDTFGLGAFGVTSQLGDLATAAGGTPAQASDLSGMFVAFATNIPSIMKLVSFASICGGAFMILRAVLMLPQLEQGRVEGTKIIWLLIAGLGLWALLPVLNMSLTTMGAGGDVGNILTTKYTQSQGGGFDSAIASVMVFIQLLGLIAFVRGVMILKLLGESKDGAMGRALTHIFGGAAALNIAWTVKMLAFSIGATTQICGISINLCA